jgi:putative aldouronate transport system substrate-binding protein
MRLFDFLFAPQGRHLMSFGAEGLTFDLVDGEPVFRDMVFEQGSPVPNFLRDEIGSIGWLGHHQMFEYEMQIASPEAYAAFELYGTGEFFVRQLPQLGFMPEEQTIIAEIQATLNAFLDESIQAMIINDWTLVEGQWAAFVQGAIDMGALELVEAYQSAFDRFNTNFGN